MAVLINVFVSIAFGMALVSAEDVVVSTKSGKVAGKIAQDRKGVDFYSFQSIPYAEPPLGPLRFKAPEPVEKWHGILQATEPPPDCLQEHFTKLNKIIGQEDCLYLNIYTPELPNDDENYHPKPVMVFIHGGAFYQGSSARLGPEHLLAEEIVLVTFNYRLGLLGFLNFQNQSSGVPGNAGLKDQVMALKWIKENVINFGGDPESVTLFGQSVGASSVHFHIMSPMSAGLFHRAIMQSGTALSYWAYCANNTGKILADHLNITGRNEEGVLEILRALPAKELLRSQIKLTAMLEAKNSFIAGAVVEKQTNERAFLREPPIDSIEYDKYKKLPLMVGHDSQEGLVFEVINKIKTGGFLAIDNFTSFIPGDLTNRTAVAEAASKFYLGDKPNKGGLPYQPTVDFIGDAWFIYPVLEAAMRYAIDYSGPVYLYRFSADTRLNYFKNYVTGLSDYKGACHEDELGYLFKIASRTPEIEEGSVEDVAVDTIVKLWTNFAKHGNPTPKSYQEQGNVKWKQLLPYQMINMVDIGSKLKVLEFPDLNGYSFWADVYTKYASR